MPRKGTPNPNAGRPPPNLDEFEAKLVPLLKAGNFIDVAVRAAGVSTSSFYAWCDRGRKEGVGPYRKFLDAIQRAVAEAESMQVSMVARAAFGNQKEGIEGDWRAAAWMLERKSWKRWGRREMNRVEAVPLNAEDNKTSMFTDLPEEELLARLERKRAKAAAAAKSE